LFVFVSIGGESKIINIYNKYKNISVITVIFK
jgi:hypothetical protein